MFIGAQAAVNDTEFIPMIEIRSAFQHENERTVFFPTSFSRDGIRAALDWADNTLFYRSKMRALSAKLLLRTYDSNVYCVLEWDYRCAKNLMHFKRWLPLIF